MYRGDMRLAVLSEPRKDQFHAFNVFLTFLNLGIVEVRREII